MKWFRVYLFLLFSFFFFPLSSSHAFFSRFFFCVRFSKCFQHYIPILMFDIRHAVVVIMKWYVTRIERSTPLPCHSQSVSTSVVASFFYLSDVYPMYARINTHSSYSRIDLSHWDLTKTKILTYAFASNGYIKTPIESHATIKKKLWQSLFLRQQYLLNSF